MNQGKTPTPTPLFDRQLIRSRRTRGAKESCDAFLHSRVAEDIAERVLDVNREFSSSLLLGSQEISNSLIAQAGHKLGHVIRGDHTNSPAGLDLICDEETLPFSESF